MVGEVDHDALGIHPERRREALGGSSSSPSMTRKRWLMSASMATADTLARIGIAWTEEESVVESRTRAARHGNERMDLPNPCRHRSQPGGSSLALGNLRASMRARMPFTWSYVFE